MTHGEAAKIIREAWARVYGRGPSSRELLYTQAIAALETGYGRAGQFGALAARGLFNWGGLQRRPSGGECPEGTVPGSDQGATCFFVYDTDVEAAAAFIRNLTGKHWPVLAAMARGAPEDVARAMRKPPAYYNGTAATEDGKVAEYARAIRAQIKAMGQTAPGNTAATGTVLGFGLLGLGAWLFLKEK